ncbi:acidic endochitinase SE2 [Magnaporthiopsis poae ATCC 64411]|uniref:Acidic endochitinase SE2 n=1 Tax=Magnaporthiopsis poae (strain ATCC 64411 / 73-15) TaxID=644358 RepID=A0A0C4E5C9_MAGP6|nr:acidic endochitinase SE2 [Magnaporthiopsis poae ATCC 64411]
MARTFPSCAQLLIATFLLLALPEAEAGFSLAAKTNVAVYYGQGPNQKELLQYCKEPSIDVIILSFIHLFPAQANGYPGSNFGNQCRGAVYAGPGPDRSKNALQADCPILRTRSCVRALIAGYGSVLRHRSQALLRPRIQGPVARRFPSVQARFAAASMGIAASQPCIVVMGVNERLVSVPRSASK